jgi:hypothetical protein
MSSAMINERRRQLIQLLLIFLPKPVFLYLQLMLLDFALVCLFLNTCI